MKQLKEVLMLHRVDYKGCCEKQELLDRVSRLWKTMRECPGELWTLHYNFTLITIQPFTQLLKNSPLMSCARSAWMRRLSAFF